MTFLMTGMDLREIIMEFRAIKKDEGKREKGSITLEASIFLAIFIA